ncbi:hypothetical protein [Stenotrophomonas nematodicola]|uniref:Uncharacterized protein n=1 Tax=Stenotrophomonas nematodicola TaxID=2656746 RepID=A0ABW7CX56_9GAMM
MAAFSLLLAVAVNAATAMLAVPAEAFDQDLDGSWRTLVARAWPASSTVLRVSRSPA